MATIRGNQIDINNQDYDNDGVNDSITISLKQTTSAGKIAADFFVVESSKKQSDPQNYQMGQMDAFFRSDIGSTGLSSQGQWHLKNVSLEGEVLRLVYQDDYGVSDALEVGLNEFYNNMSASTFGVLGALADGSELDEIFGSGATRSEIGGLIGAKGTQIGSGGLGSRGSGLGGGGTAQG